MSILAMVFLVIFYGLFMTLAIPSLGRDGTCNDVLVILFLLLYPLYLYGYATKRKKFTLLLCVFLNIILLLFGVLSNITLGSPIYKIQPFMLIVLIYVSLGGTDLLLRKNKKIENREE
jgi:hypothetical protein